MSSIPEREIINLVDSNSEEIIDLVDSDLETESTKESLAKRNEPSYYQRAFLSILTSVLEVYPAILSQSEIQSINIITGDLDDSAQKLFIRLMLRKPGWLSVRKLSYDDIPKIQDALNTLIHRRLCDLDSQVLEDYLDQAVLPELKYISGKLFVNIPNASSVNHQALCKLIATSKSTGQRQLCFSTDGGLNAASSSNNKADVVRKTIGSIARINERVRECCEFAISLYFLVSNQSNAGSAAGDLSTAILVEINRRSYPKYKIIRSSSIFRTRSDYLAYQAALNFESSVIDGDCVEEDTILEAETSMQVAIDGFDASSSYFLRRYSAGWIYCRTLGYLAGALETAKMYERAVGIYQSLLKQDQFCLGRRGKWWERLVIDLVRHLKLKDEAIESCKQALMDSHLRTASRLSIERRLRNLEQKPDSSCDNDLETIVLRGKIDGSSRQTGRKVKLRLQDGDELALGSVEEFVLEEFERDGWCGVHCESSCFTTIFALLYWDLLFSSEDSDFDSKSSNATAVPDVFQTPYQTAPLDLTTDAFYLSRREALEHRLALIEEDFHAALKLLRANHFRYHGITCLGVNWNDYGGEEGIGLLLQVANGIGPMALSVIMRQYCEDYRSNRSGVPDLILWRTGKSDSRLVSNANRVVFVEVKSPNDRLSDAQRHWMSVLKNAGLRAIVVRVLEDEEKLEGNVDQSEKRQKKKRPMC